MQLVVIFISMVVRSADLRKRRHYTHICRVIAPSNMDYCESYCDLCLARFVVMGSCVTNTVAHALLAITALAGHVLPSESARPVDTVRLLSIVLRLTMLLVETVKNHGTEDVRVELSTSEI